MTQRSLSMAAPRYWEVSERLDRKCSSQTNRGFPRTARHPPSFGSRCCPHTKQLITRPIDELNGEPAFFCE